MYPPTGNVQVRREPIHGEKFECIHLGMCAFTCLCHELRLKLKYAHMLLYIQVVTYACVHYGWYLHPTAYVPSYMQAYRYV